MTAKDVASSCRDFFLAGWTVADVLHRSAPATNKQPPAMLPSVASGRPSAGASWNATLGNEKQAGMLINRLVAAGYDVMVADVETTRESGRPARWAVGSAAILRQGTARPQAGTPSWEAVGCLSSFPVSLFTAEDSQESICAAKAAAVATEYTCVSEYVAYRVADQHSGPKLETTMGRAKPDGGVC